MLLLGRREIEALLEPQACLEAVEQAMIALHRGQAVQPPRTVVSLHEATDSALFMPAVLDRAKVPGRPSSPTRSAILGTKVVTIYPRNHDHGIASHHGAMLVFEADHGRPVALLEGSSITAIRTAAVSALATRLLARRESRILALLGTGVQARSHLTALLAVSDFTEVRIWSPRQASRRSFLQAIGSAHGTVDIRATSSAAEAVHLADVITTVTSSPEPVLEAGWIAPGTHINAVGASTTSTRELDSRTVASATLFVDHRAAAVAEAGELMIPVAEGMLTESHIRAELGAVAAGESPGRTSREEVTLFKSVGLAVQDLAAAAVVIEAAERFGAGQVVDWS